MNELLDDAAQTRLEAHYTFLGKFLHPTHGAARELHERSNIYDGSTAVGIRQPYAKTAVLLASLYVAYCLAGLLDEIAGLHEAAPERYIADAGTATLRSMTRRVPGEFPYFWFLFNEPPLYDKFNFASYHVSEDDLRTYGGYAKVPGNLVPFDQHIYDRFARALLSSSNPKCGVYESPLSRS